MGIFSKGRTIKWSESWAFVRARNKHSKTRFGLRYRFLVGSIAVLITQVMWVLGGRQTTALDALVTGLLAALFFIYPFRWLLLYLPKKVKLCEFWVDVDQEVIRYEDIDYVILGDADMGGIWLPAMSIRGKKFGERSIGLSNKVDINELREYLSDHGVRVER